MTESQFNLFNTAFAGAMCLMLTALVLFLVLLFVMNRLTTGPGGKGRWYGPVYFAVCAGVMLSIGWSFVGAGYATSKDFDTARRKGDMVEFSSFWKPWVWRSVAVSDIAGVSSTNIVTKARNKTMVDILYARVELKGGKGSLMSDPLSSNRLEHFTYWLNTGSNANPADAYPFSPWKWIGIGLLGGIGAFLLVFLAVLPVWLAGRKKAKA